MFVIPCKFNLKWNYILNLVPEIRKFHPNEKIVVVDSDSDDKSYFDEIKKHGVEIEDIANKNWYVGAHWHCYKKWPNEDFYYFMHDSMHVKGNMDYLKINPLTILYYFPRSLNESFNMWSEKIIKETKFKTYNYNGNGAAYGIYFCQRWVMEKLMDAGVDKLLPNNKPETGYIEGGFGFCLEQLGFNLTKCALYGDFVLDHTKIGRCGEHPPHNTSWQFPVEKFYAVYDGRK